MDSDGLPGGLQDEWLRTILSQMLDRETKMHIGEKITGDGISYDRAKSIITDFITTNEEESKPNLDNVGTQGGDKQGGEQDWNLEQYKEALNALKGGGKAGNGKGNCWNCGKPGHRAFECWNAPKGGKGGKNGEDGGKGKGKDGTRTLSQGYGGKANGKGEGKKGWSPKGFQGNCYNCGEPGHSAKWCTKAGKGGISGKMSWMGGGGLPWEPEWNG